MTSGSKVLARIMVIMRSISAVSWHHIARIHLSSVKQGGSGGVDKMCFSRAWAVPRVDLTSRPAGDDDFLIVVASSHEIALNGLFHLISSHLIILSAAAKDIADSIEWQQWVAALRAQDRR